MRLSRYLLATLRDDPKDAEVISHRWMLRAGMVRKLAAGIYELLPSGLRVIRRIEAIVREEMNRAGALEVQLPVVQPAELWQESRRWDAYGRELLRFRDRHERDFVLGPTHEEVITDLVRREVVSYKQLPLNLYQIHTKFRDEIRPRFGLMRAREFTMKDAYSFHIDEAGLDAEYENMVATYNRIFTRCGLDYRAVEADTGSIGGSSSHEFMVLADTGEDALAFCTNCSYAANVEKARTRTPLPAARPTQSSAEPVATPDRRSIEEVSAFLGVPAEAMIKTLVFAQAGGPPVVACVRGDRDVAEAKVRAAIGADWLELMEPEAVAKHFGVPVGFLGPVGLRDVVLLVDPGVLAIADGVTGANRPDMHLRHVVPGRDFACDRVVDIAAVRDGDPCPVCEPGVLEIKRGIEVGHVFKLGRKYAEALGATVLDDSGKSVTLTMGCYGIGIGRTAAAAIEQNHDERGIIWPPPLAPFAVVVAPLDTKDAALAAAAESLYRDLGARGIDVALDDRNERAGVKLTDAEILGIPFVVVLGKRGFAAGTCELKRRCDGSSEEVPLTEAAARLAALLGAST